MNNRNKSETSQGSYFRSGLKTEPSEIFSFLSLVSTCDHDDNDIRGKICSKSLMNGKQCAHSA